MGSSWAIIGSGLVTGAGRSQEYQVTEVPGAKGGQWGQQRALSHWPTESQATPPHIRSR